MSESNKPYVNPSSCFIQGWDMGLIEELEKLGFEDGFGTLDEKDELLVATAFNYKWQQETLPDILEPIYMTDEIFGIEDYLERGYTDCGTDREMFLGLAKKLVESLKVENKVKS